MNDLPTKEITEALILITIAVWVGWDIVAYVDPQSGDTESELILNAFQTHPSLSYLFGVLCGHWVWPNQNTFTPTKMFTSWGIGLVFIGVDLCTPALTDVPIVVLFAVGFVAGHFLWGQSPKSN